MEHLPREANLLESEKKYWCHQCHFEFKLPAYTVQVSCFKCKGDFCEEILDEQNDPRKFVPYTAPTTLQSRNLNPPQSSVPIQNQNSFRPPQQLNQFPINFSHMLSNVLGISPNIMNPSRTTVQITNFQIPSTNHLMMDQLFSAIFPNSPALNLENYFESALQQIMQNDPNAYGNPPASVQAVQSLPTLKVDEEFFRKEGAKECTVCKEDFKSEELLKELPCKHRFHDGCILPWLRQHNSCPTCRFELPTDDPDFESRKLLRSASNNQRANSSGPTNQLRVGPQQNQGVGIQQPPAGPQMSSAYIGSSPVIPGNNQSTSLILNPGEIRNQDSVGSNSGQSLSSTNMQIINSQTQLTSTNSNTSNPINEASSPKSKKEETD